jgi:cold shock CspA family protein
MRTILIAAASAIFFAAVTVELSTRLWPDSYLALLIIATIALFCNGILSTRLAAAPAAAPAGDRQGNRGSAGNSRSRSRSTRGSRGESTKQRRPEQDPEAAEAPPSGPREDGTVKWFNRSKGYGFIIRDNGDEIFVHQRSIRQVGEGENRRRPALRDGQAVNFVVATRDKGAQAEDVTGSD